MILKKKKVLVSRPSSQLIVPTRSSTEILGCLTFGIKLLLCGHMVAVPPEKAVDPVTTNTTLDVLVRRIQLVASTTNSSRTERLILSKRSIYLHRATSSGLVSFVLVGGRPVRVVQPSGRLLDYLTVPNPTTDSSRCKDGRSHKTTGSYGPDEVKPWTDLSLENFGMTYKDILLHPMEMPRVRNADDVDAEMYELFEETSVQSALIQCLCTLRSDLTNTPIEVDPGRFSVLGPGFVSENRDSG